MNNSLSFFSIALSSAVFFTLSAQAAPTQTAPQPTVSVAKSEGSPSTEDKVKAEFSNWRYEGAKIVASFQRGPMSLLSISTDDDMEKVWKFYLSRVPTDNKVPLAYSWEIPGDNTMVGANYTLGSSYAVSLNAGPRDSGTIIYQKGIENFVIEIRARTPQQIKESGVQTDIKLIKMRPIETPKVDDTKTKPVQGAATPATTW